jgi:uncharacterized protein DUF4013
VSEIVAPVTPPPPPPPPPAKPANVYDFGRPFAFVFEDPEWVQKILLGGVFVLASVVLIGVFFIYGYLARLVRNVIAGVQYPLPSWDDLGEYFSEGLRLFGVGLIYIAPMIALVMLFVVPTIVADATDNEIMRNVGGMTAACVWCLVFPLSLALGIWMPAALLMAVVDRRFSAAFEFGRIWNFIRGNAGNYALAWITRMAASFLAQFGIVFLCIGIVFTGFWAAVVGAYAFAQAYRLSLSR